MNCCCLVLVPWAVFFVIVLLLRMVSSLLRMVSSRWFHLLIFSPQLTLLTHVRSPKIFLFIDTHYVTQYIAHTTTSYRY
jgi:hypothetical protein